MTGKPTSACTNSIKPCCMREQRTPSRSLYYLIDEYVALFQWADETCRDALNSPHVDKILQIHASQPFDLVVTEMFDTDCSLGIIHQLNVPYVGLSSCALFPWYYDRVNLPDIPSYIPSEFVGFPPDMGFFDRIMNWITTRTMKTLYRWVGALRWPVI